MQSKRTLFFIEIAIFTALAFILDIIPFLSFKIWPQGGSISFSMIPIFIVAYRWGVKGGMLAGLLHGILPMVTGTAYIVHPVQAILDYPVAFTVLGLAGIFAPAAQVALKNKNTKRFVGMVTIGVLIALALRFIAHFWAGVVFFGSASPDMNAWVYSLVYNSSYLIPSFVINVAAVGFLFGKRPELLSVTK